MNLPTESIQIIQTLDLSIRADLQNLRDTYFNWLLVSAAVVAVGVVMEGPELVHEATHVFQPFPHGEPKTPRWVVLLAMIGWALVVLGVAGEGIAEGFVSRADGLVQNFNDILLTDARKESAFAIERAASAYERASHAEAQLASARRDAAVAEQQAAEANRVAESERLARLELEGSVAWRRLSKNEQHLLTLSMLSFKQVYAALQYSDMEGSSFASDIALSLRAAGMQVFSPSWMMTGPVSKLNGPIEKAASGIDISTTEDSTAILAGNTVHDVLESFGFDASRVRTVPAPGKPRASQIWVAVLPRPEGLQGAAKLRAERKKGKQANGSQGANP